MSSDHERIRIRQLDDKSDYALWRIRVTAMIDAKGFSDALSRAPGDESARQASNIVVSTLSDQALRVVRSVIGKPAEMLSKLDSRYDSKSTASKIAKVSEIVSTRYCSLNEDMSVHVDRMAGLLEQLKSRGMTIDDSLAIGILVASIDVPELMPVTASIKTLAEADVKWEEVANRLIEDSKSISSGNGLSARASAATVDTCQICKKPNHKTENCFLNPMGKNCKLDISDDTVSSLLGGKSNSFKSDRGSQNKSGERSAMARHSDGADTRMPDRIMIDSGTTTHITPFANRVVSKTPQNVLITLADESTVRSSHCGVRKVTFMTDNGPQKVSLSKTLVVPDAGMSLLSVPALTKKDIGVFFMPGFAVLYDLLNDFNVLGYAEQDQDGLFFISDDGKTPSPKRHSKADERQFAIMATVIGQARARYEATNGHKDSSADDDSDKTDGARSFASAVEIVADSSKRTDESVKTWHLRLGHALPVKAVRRHVREGLLPHVVCKSTDCKVCLKGKFRRRFDGSLTDTDKFGSLHVDTKGKVDVTSVHGHNYFVTIVEEFSRFVAVRPIRSKSDAAEEVLRFVKYFEKQTGHPVRKIHTDGGTEFRRALDRLDADGVQISVTTAHTPESNGLAERAHQTILSLARSCLYESKLPEKYWSYAIRHVADCRNFVSGKKGMSPYGVLFGNPPPGLGHLRPFGCHMVCRPSGNKIGTFATRAIDGLCLCHEAGGVYQVLTGDRILRTKHVKALERSFPGLDLFSDSSDQLAHADNEVDLSDLESAMRKAEAENSALPDVDSLTYIPAVPSRYGKTDVDDFNSARGSDDEQEIFPATHGQYSLRPRHRSNVSCMAKTEIVSDTDEPKLSVALRSADGDKWVQAINDEFDVIAENRTWVNKNAGNTVPSGAEVLPSGIILRIKRDSHGDVAKYKARLVVRGNLQSNETDYAALYAPVACIELVRLLLAVSVVKSFVVDQLDVKSAFLHADLPATDNIWVKLPKISGISRADGSLVKLRKSLYGLRQAPKLWYELLAKTLSLVGFSRSHCSECLFMSGSGTRPVYIVAYVDDLLVIGDKTSVKKAKNLISRHVNVTDIGPCSHFLGIKIDRRDDGLFLSQGAYTRRVLDMAKMADCKPTGTPLPLAHPLYREQAASTPSQRQEMSTVPYRQVLGSLIYLSTRTRPDIATAVSMLGKFQADPVSSDWKALKHLLRYLKGSLDYGILFPYQSDSHGLEAWSDADWARDESARRSRSGVFVAYSGCPIIWMSKMQTATATSTAEAEFGALSVAVREVVWTRNVLAEIDFPEKAETVIWQDNLGAISWTEKVQGLRRVKHVGIRYHFVREAVDSGRIKVLYTPSDSNRADSLTKILGKEMHHVHCPFLVSV